MTDVIEGASDGAGGMPVELTADELIELFRDGKGPKGAADIVARLDGAEAALATANDEITKLRAELEKAKAKPKTVKAGAKSEKARDFSKLPERPEVTPASEKRAVLVLAESLAEAETVELVMTFKGKEVRAIPPFVIGGNPWRESLDRLMLTEPVDIKADGTGELVIDGYALIIEGKPVAHRARGEALHVPPGQSLRLVDDVIF
jgi:hypothetical protein